MDKKLFKECLISAFRIRTRKEQEVILNYFVEVATIAIGFKAVTEIIEKSYK